MPDKSVLAAFRSKLGKIPDQQIADQAKVSRTLVVNYRKKLGIPAYQGHRAPAAAPKRPEETATRPFRGRRSALDAWLDRLGKVPDAEIAQLAGVTAENVRTYRQRRNIPAGWKGQEPAQVPATSPEASPGPAARKRGRPPAAPAVAAAEPAGPAVSAAPAVAAAEIAAPAVLAAPAVAAAQTAAPAVPTAPAAPAAPAPTASARRRGRPAPVALASPAAPGRPAPPSAADEAPSVPASGPATPAPAAAAAFAAPHSPATAAVAYAVSVETDEGTRTYALVAEDIASAARDAAARVEARHPGATIRAIQRVAELLPG